MITPSEAYSAMEEMIRCLPQKRPEGFGFILSKDFSNALVAYLPVWSGLKIMQTGDEFTWKGIKCKVA